MAVTTNSTRKAVEIAWDPNASPEEPPTDAHPEHPIWDDSIPHPDHGLPKPEEPVDPDYSVPEDGPRPEHPIVIPPDLEEGLTDEQIEKIKSFLEGNLPPYEGGPEYPVPVSAEEVTVKAVRIFAQGMEGDWSNTSIMPNDGFAVLTYPQGFTGESYVEVRDANDGSLVDTGTITV